MKYGDMTKEQAEVIFEKELRNFKKIQGEELSLDMSRGKPCTAQLDLANELFEEVNSKNSFILENGTDVRNYGGIDGIPEMKKLFASLFDVSDKNVLVADGSSLNIMYNLVQHAMQFGVGGGVPFNKLGKVKFICLVPGYDRHFAITEHFGVDMISVPFKKDGGVDIDAIEGLVATDSSIKGIWCVPKYSNPTGITYSDDVVTRLAKMPATEDFRIYWDNAYAVHGIYGDDILKNIFPECEKAGNPDRVYMFASTSKITLSGAGVATLISSEKNIEEYKSHLKFATIGPNKVVQLAHYRYLKSPENILKIMNAQAEILRPKFDAVQNILESEFENGDIVEWTKPVGGYFVSLNVKVGSAKEVVDLSKKMGVKFTEAGATYPRGIDFNDSNIRIAPSYPPIEELETAMQVLCCAIKLASMKTLMR